ncbi:MAG: hypothetical protein ABFC96_16925 [Thermoguttaceae bacterium]
MNDELQTRMAELRADLGRNVEQTVQNARAMLSWRHYVAEHPWLCLGGAATAGFLLVPSRSRYGQLSPDATAELTSRGMVVVKPESLPSAKKHEVLSNLAGAAAKMAMRMAVARFTQYLENRLRARGESGHG